MDRLKCENIKESHALFSLMFASVQNPSFRSDYYFLPPDEIRNNADLIYAGYTNPRCALMVEASLLRKNEKVISGVTKKEFSEEDKQKKLKVSEVEIAFEGYRQRFHSGLPSRLTCLFLVDNSENGMSTLSTMLVQSNLIPYVFEVEIKENYGLHRADKRWFEKYFKSNDEVCIKNYWEGVAFNELPAWEHLLEGAIVIVNDVDYNHICLYGSSKEPEN